MQVENTGEVQEVTQPVETVENQAPEVTEKNDAQESTEIKTESVEAPRDEKGRFKPVQDRINELTKQRHQAEREAEYWKAQASGSASKNEKPNPENYTDYTQYVEALSDYKAAEKVNEALGKRDQDQVSQAEAKVREYQNEVLSERLSQVRKDLPDFDAVVGASDIVFPAHVMESIQDADLKIAYHLAKNPDVAKRLAGMSQREADREIGRLEAKLDKQPIVTKPVSNAPEPIVPTRGLNAGNVASDPDKMSSSEFAAWAKKNGSKWIS